jgi:pilus assembly protein CpaF
MFRITLTAEGIEPKIMEFDQNEITIGRLSSADIQLKANNVSKQHSRIVYREGRYFIIDRKSTNGTFVNGNRVSVPISLKTGDKIFIGDFSLDFEGDDNAPAQAASKSGPVPPPLPMHTEQMQGDVDKTEPPRSALPDITAAMLEEESVEGQLDTADFEILEDSQEPDPDDLFRELCLELYVAAGDFEEFEDLEAFLEYRLDDEELIKTVGGKLNALIDEFAPEWITQNQRDAAIEHLLGELLGFGVLEDYLEDDEVEQVFINGPEMIVVGKGGAHEVSSSFFTCEEALFNVLVRLLDPYDILLSDDTAILNAVTPEFAINGVLHPFSTNGSALTFTKTPIYQETMESLLEGEVISEKMADYLSAAVKDGKTILVTGSNTEERMNVLAALAQAIPANQRLVTFNLGAALDLPHADKVVVESAAGDRLESELVVDPGELLRNVTRMHVDRLIVREVEESFALDMLMALNAGLSGSLFTVFGSGCNDALLRLRRMAGFGDDAGRSYVSELIGATVDVTVSVKTYKNGESRVNCICEVSESDKGWERKTRFGFKASVDNEDTLAGEFSAS